MLSLLAFKQSLFSGVLDGGESNVTLEGTRLSRFMKQVEQATAPLDEAPTSPDSAMAQASDGKTVQPVSEPPDVAPQATVPLQARAPVAAANPWQPLFDIGVRLIDELRKPPGASIARPAVDSLMRCDPESGERYLRIPAPDPEAVEQLATALTRLLAGGSK